MSVAALTGPRTKFVQEFESSRENLRQLEESLESLKEEEGARLIETEQEKEDSSASVPAPTKT